MKTHTTNHPNLFIEVAEDCPAEQGEVPPHKGDAKTVATMQFELLHGHPYQYTSDDVVFQVYADRHDLTKKEYKEARARFFSKGQPCLRTSALTKRYGWGVHSDADGKIALYGRDSQEYKAFSKDQSLRVVKAMRTGK